MAAAKNQFTKAQYKFIIALQEAGMAKAATLTHKQIAEVATAAGIKFPYWVIYPRPYWPDEVGVKHNTRGYARYRTDTRGVFNNPALDTVMGAPAPAAAGRPTVPPVAPKASSTTKKVKATAAGKPVTAKVKKVKGTPVAAPEVTEVAAEPVAAGGGEADPFGLQD